MEIHTREAEGNDGELPDRKVVRRVRDGEADLWFAKIPSEAGVSVL